MKTENQTGYSVVSEKDKKVLGRYTTYGDALANSAGGIIVPTKLCSKYGYKQTVIKNEK